MYKLAKNHFNGEHCSVIRLSDDAVIPFDENNSDYTIYLAWLAEGNEPLGADE